MSENLSSTYVASREMIAVQQKQIQVLSSIHITLVVIAIMLFLILAFSMVAVFSG